MFYKVIAHSAPTVKEEGGNSTPLILRREEVRSVARCVEILNELSQETMDDWIFGFFFGDADATEPGRIILDIETSGEAFDLNGDQFVVLGRLYEVSFPSAQKAVLRRAVVSAIHRFCEENILTQERLEGFDALIFFAGRYGIVRDNNEAYETFLELLQSHRYDNLVHDVRLNRTVTTNMLRAILEEAKRRMDRRALDLCTYILEDEGLVNSHGPAFGIVVGFSEEYYLRYFHTIVSSFHPPFALGNAFYALEKEYGADLLIRAIKSCYNEYPPLREHLVDSIHAYKKTLDKNGMTSEVTALLAQFE